jgi:hypothetical protein
VKSCCLISGFYHFPYILWAERTIPLHPEHLFQSRMLFVSLEKVFVFPRYDHFSQIRGIKPEYALLNFCRVNISVFYFFSFFFLFLGCYSFRSVYALFPMPCVISKIRNRSERVFLSMYALCRALCVISVNQK